MIVFALLFGAICGAFAVLICNIKDDQVRSLHALGMRNRNDHRETHHDETRRHPRDPARPDPARRGQGPMLGR
jgi:hypothetical protein